MFSQQFEPLKPKNQHRLEAVEREVPEMQTFFPHCPHQRKRCY